MASTLDKAIPAPPDLANPVTGEVVDRDDLEAVVAAIADADAKLEELGAYALYRMRKKLRQRRGELELLDLPAPREQSAAQRLIRECPRCHTRLPRLVVTDAEAPD